MHSLTVSKVPTMIYVICFVALILGAAHGHHNDTHPDDRIIGGQYAGVGQFPYMASLQQSGSHTCGGSIITNRWILTAGHCVNGKVASLYTVVVGTIQLYQNSGTRYGVQQFILHQTYNSTGRINDDIGLVRTTATIVYTTYVKQIAIYGAPLGGNQPVIISGWGKTSPTSTVSTYLKYTQLRSLTDAQCSAAWNYNTGPNQICTAATSDTGACNGDSGSPLTYNGNQVGLASYVSGNCIVSHPNVYTRVLNYVPWIRANIY